jgi:hypothetical protein
MKNLVLLLALSLLLSPLSAKKKPKAPPVPVQPDIVKGCVTIQKITFHRTRWNYPAEIVGRVTNQCGSGAYVELTASFFNGAGIEIGSGSVSQLIPTSGSDFGILVENVNAGYNAFNIAFGQLTSAFVRLGP